MQLSNPASPLGLFHSFGPTLIWGLVQVRCQVAGREVRPSEKESPVSSCLALFISKQEHSFMSRTALPGALGLPCRGIRGRCQPRGELGEMLDKQMSCRDTPGGGPGAGAVPRHTRGAQGPARVSASFPCSPRILLPNPVLAVYVFVFRSTQGESVFLLAS